MAIFRPDEEGRVRELLDALDRPVDLLVALGPEETPLPGSRDIDFGEETQRVVEGLAVLSDRVTFRVEEEPPGFERYPAIAMLPDGEDVGLRYYGLPWGYELATLVGGGALIWFVIIFFVMVVAELRSVPSGLSVVENQRVHDTGGYASASQIDAALRDRDEGGELVPEFEE